MSETISLKLKLLEAAQAQKHITHNDALLALDALVQLSVLDRDLSAPPASPAEGDRYIVAQSATGDWAGQDNFIAAWQDNAWRFFAPQPGWAAWVVDEARNLQFDGTGWVNMTADILANVAELGVNAVADPVNRLAVASEVVLLNHDGSGVQLKLNKNTLADTASILYQSSFSGRAEIGLAGNDDLSFKASSDGATWFEALRIDGAIGDVALPQGLHTGSVNNGPLAGFRNLLINGCFRVWQRATSAPHAGGYSYDAPDRWGGRRGTNAAGMSVSRQTGDKAQYALRVQRDSGNASAGTIFVSTALETSDVIPLQGRPMTLSFRARAGAGFSAASSNLQAEIRSGTGTDQKLDMTFASGDAAVSTNQIALTTSWQEFNVSGIVAGGISGLGVLFSFIPVGTAGADDWFEIELVQLEIGTYATQFELRPFAIEENACLRYFERWDFSGSSAFAIAGARSTSFATATIKYIRKRTPPSVSESGTWDMLGVAGDSNSLAFAGIEPDSCQINITDANAKYVFQAAMTLSSSPGNYVEMDAEL